MLVAVLLGLLAVGIAIGVYAIVAPRRPVAVETARSAPAGASPPTPTEAERVDEVFALSALDGDESTRRLTAALDDPSETVALAAAHALAASERGAILTAYARANPGARSQRLVDTIEWMHE
ncbi:MAG TPA: hypothetical protein VIG46_13040 [Candidatus Baltobacteraceae bacterium]